MQMRVRHENLIDTAHFLWTETQPRLVSQNTPPMARTRLMNSSTTSPGKPRPKKKTASKTKSTTRMRPLDEKPRNTKLVWKRMPDENDKQKLIVMEILLKLLTGTM